MSTHNIHIKKTKTKKNKHDRKKKTVQKTGTKNAVQTSRQWKP